MNVTNSTKSEFWDERYKAHKTPWDFQGVPSALQHFLRITPKRGRVLIPGCGSGYEIKAFLKAGWDAWGLDFSKTAVKSAQTLLGAHRDRVLHEDFFEYPFKDRFDVIYERTFLCALPPELWKGYAKRMKDLLVPAGQLLGFFYYGPEDDPPPYPLTTRKADRLFASAFRLIKDDPVQDSLPLFAGKERWQQWEKAEK